MGLQKKLKTDTIRDMNILLYYQNSYHTVFLESLVAYFIKKGHKVFFLTTCEKGVLHTKMEDLGAEVCAHTYPSHTGKLIQFIGQWNFLINYCRKNKIAVVYSHLQLANLVAVFAQYFISAKVFPCRHHSNDVILRGNKNAIRLDKLVSSFSRKIIVVSNAVKSEMVTREKIKAEKIIVIPLGYNFEIYDKPDPLKVSAISEQMKCDFRLIVIGRMNKNKKHIVALRVLKRLVSEGYNIKMILLDQGTEEASLKAFVKEKKLTDHVLFTGFLNNTMDHIAAADMLIHPSVSEASNQVVKEAAILHKPSIVCSGVGDFDEYITHKENGLIVSKESSIQEMYELIKEYFSKKNELQRMGEQINLVVRTRFDINISGSMYLDLAISN